MVTNAQMYDMLFLVVLAILAVVGAAYAIWWIKQPSMKTVSVYTTWEKGHESSRYI